MEKVLELLEKMGERETLLHFQNGRYLQRTPEVEIFQEAIKNKMPDLAFKSEISPEGHFEVKVYIVGSYAIVSKRWVPLPPYSWEEEILEVIRL